MKKLLVIIAAALAAVSCGTTLRQIVGDPYGSTSSSTSNTSSTAKASSNTAWGSSSVRGSVNPLMVGRWLGEQDIYGSNGEGKATDCYVFNSDGTFNQEGSLTMKLVKDNIEYTYEFAVRGAGRYGVENGKIYFDYDPDKASSELVGFDTRSANGKGSIDSKAENSIKMFTINPMKKSFLKSMKQDHVFILDSVGDSRLVMTDTQGTNPQPQAFVKAL